MTVIKILNDAGYPNAKYEVIDTDCGSVLVIKCSPIPFTLPYICLNGQMNKGLANEIDFSKSSSPA